jgi:hypothetical protein
VRRELLAREDEEVVDGGSATLGCVENMSLEGQRTVLEFFFVFARFEFALKRTSRFLSTGRGNAAKPAWDKFETEIGAAYPSLDSEDFRQARGHILGKPPQRQVVFNNELRWEALPDKKTEISFLLSCVRTMRNNLFHGGKFPGLVVKGAERDLPLLSSGAVVLRAVATLDEEVRAAFDLGPEPH